MGIAIAARVMALLLSISSLSGIQVFRYSGVVVTPSPFRPFTPSSVLCIGLGAPDADQLGRDVVFQNRRRLFGDVGTLQRAQGGVLEIGTALQSFERIDDRLLVGG